MFAGSYFAARFYAARYFAKVGAAAAVPAVFGDLTTLFAGYLVTLRNTGSANDLDTEIDANLATVRAASTNLDDANTMYSEYLS